VWLAISIVPYSSAFGRHVRNERLEAASNNLRTPAKVALERVRRILSGLGLELHPQKTRTVDLRYGRDRFDFLGCTLLKQRSIQRRPDRYYMQRRPSARVMKRIRERVHRLTQVQENRARDVMEIIAWLNPVLRGWGNYFRSGNADRKFNQVDHYVRARIVGWLLRRSGQRSRCCDRNWHSSRLHAVGLHRLSGSVLYTTQAIPRRSSASRVPEIGRHGLNGGPTVTASQGRP
jgi:RNA-directed DNA polymerase